MANKKRPREWIPTHKWSIDYLENILETQLTQSEWDAKVMDKILHHHTSEYLKFISRWEQMNRRK